MTDFEQKLAALRTEFDEKLAALTMEVKTKQGNERIWCPHKDDVFYFVDGDGEVNCTEWTGVEMDERMMGIGNVFHTLEDAEFAVERLKVLAEMKWFAFDPDWNDASQTRFKLWYDKLYDSLCLDYARCSEGVPVFASEQDAYDCIDTIGTVRLKKYWFGIREE